MSADGTADVDVLLERTGFDAERSALTERQAAVFVLRERGLSQADIGERLDTTRANVANIEARARENVEKARETVRFVETVRAPVRVAVEPGTDLYDVPERVYEACDDAAIEVADSAPELVKRVLEEAADAVDGRVIAAPLVVDVTAEGDPRIRRTD